MPPKSKELFIRRQKELARSKKQEEKRAKRAEKRASGGKPGSGGKGELSPDELVSVESLVGPMSDADEAADGEGDEGDDAEGGPEA